MSLDSATRSPVDRHPAVVVRLESFPGIAVAASATPADRRFRAVLDLQGCQTKDSRGRGIGRYSRSLAEALVTSRREFEISVCLNNAFVDSAEELTRDFEPLVGRRRIVRYDALAPSTPWSATVVDAGRVAGEWIAQYAWTAQKPDLVHISSLFEGLYGEAVVPDLAGMPRSTVVSATAYDVIPLIYADTYLHDQDTCGWYRSRVDRLRRCDLLLAISESTRRDVIDRLDFPADRIVTIDGAADPRFHAAHVPDERRRELLGALGLSKPYVMYTGGIDHRKNVEATVRAFGLLPPEIRHARQLAIVCSVGESDRIRLQRLAASCGLPRDGVVLTGFVPDGDLVDLYRCCELFVFPSRYEGFGLPVLEAMSCGAPTIAADASSLPEVVGWRDALFAVDSDEQIAAALAHALSDADFRSALRAHALERSRMYSWRRVADRANEAWRDALARKSERVALGTSSLKPRLALVTPLLPERSGIADFVTELLPSLAAWFRIDLFGSEGVDAGRYRAMGFDVHAWQALPAMWLDYDGGVLYQFGNSEFHVHMLALLEVCPGAVFLHDAYLSGLMAYLEFGPPRIGGFFGNMLAYSHSADAVARYRSKGLDDAIERNPMSRWVADHASGVIVTSTHARQLLLADGGAEGVRCRVVQHQRSVRATTSSDRARARERLGIPQSAVFVCSLGHVDDRKLSIQLVEAWSRRRIHASAQLAFVGESEGTYGDALRRAIKDSARTAEIDVTGYVSEETFQHYMQAADIVVQLRKGSRGEASGAALYAMAHGVPLVASRHGSLAEIPDHACVHVDDPLDTAQLAEVLADLAANPDKRATIGRRGQDWIREACDPDNVARQIASVLASFNDPAIVHRRARLKARATSFCDTIAAPMQGEWQNDVEAGAESAESRPPDADLAQTLSDALRGVVAAPSIQALVRKPRYHQMPAAGGTLTLLVSDPRFMTACGAKSGALLETTGREGVLLYGPYIGASPGRYRVRVYGSRRAGADGVAAMLEIVSGAGRHVIGSCTFAGASTAREGSVIARLDFSIDEQVEDLEVRIHVSSEIEMAVESVDLVHLVD